MQYLAHLTYVCKDVDDSFYLEEQVEKREAFLYNDMLVKDRMMMEERQMEEHVDERFQDRRTIWESLSL